MAFHAHHNGIRIVAHHHPEMDRDEATAAEQRAAGEEGESMRRKYKAELDGTLDGQWDFDFKDWEAAFELFYRKKRMNKEYCLVISTHWVTSGYWVERNAKSDKYTIVYRSLNAVQALEKRIRDRGEEYMPLLEVKRNEMLNLGGLVL